MTEIHRHTLTYFYVAWLVYTSVHWSKRYITDKIYQHSTLFNFYIVPVLQHNKITEHNCIRMSHFNFWLSLSLSESLSETLSWTLKSGLRPKFNLTLDLETLAKPVLTQRRHCHLVNSWAMVVIKLLFRQPIRQVHVFHWSWRSSEQFCISAPHSSRRNCSSSNPRHVLCLCDA